MSGAAVGLAVAGYAPLAVGVTPTAGTVVTFAAVCAGAALLPDLDHPSSVATRRFSVASWLASHLVRPLSALVYDLTRGSRDTGRGTHRGLTHTVLGALALGVGLNLASTQWGTPVLVGTLFVCLALAIKGLDDVVPGPPSLVIAAGLTLAVEMYVPGGTAAPRVARHRRRDRDGGALAGRRDHRVRGAAAVAAADPAPQLVPGRQPAAPAAADGRGGGGGGGGAGADGGRLPADRAGRARGGAGTADLQDRVVQLLAAPIAQDGAVRELPDRPVVGILHPGVMGAALGSALKARAGAVIWADAGRSDVTAKRAELADLIAVPDPAELARRSDVIVSICPPHAARAVAEEVAAAVAGAAVPPVYVEANAVAPSTVTGIGELLGPATVVDGSVIGPPAWKQGTTVLWLAGEQAQAIADLFAGTPFDARVLGPQLGAASALKACFAVQSKAIPAAWFALTAAARAYGVEEALQAELDRDGAARPSAETGPRAARAAWRWAGRWTRRRPRSPAPGCPTGSPRPRRRSTAGSPTPIPTSAATCGASPLPELSGAPDSWGRRRTEGCVRRRRYRREPVDRAGQSSADEPCSPVLQPRLPLSQPRLLWWSDGWSSAAMAAGAAPSTTATTSAAAAEANAVLRCMGPA